MSVSQSSTPGAAHKSGFIAAWGIMEHNQPYIVSKKPLKMDTPVEVQTPLGTTVVLSVGTKYQEWKAGTVYRCSVEEWG